MTARWVPTTAEVQKTRLMSFLRTYAPRVATLKIKGEKPFDDVLSLHRFSCHHREVFWRWVFEALDIQWQVSPQKILDTTAGVEDARWCVGARLNIARSCFPKPMDPASLWEKVAIVESSERAAGELKTWTYRQLWDRTQQVARAIRANGFLPGDALAIDLPMNGESVALYLGIVASGCAAVSIADSFAPHEIATRLKIANAKAIFTQDVIDRGEKQLPLYAKVKESGPTQAVLLRSDFLDGVGLRAGDRTWSEFLSKGAEVREVDLWYFAGPDEATNILFSSGTTGDPKAIPWTHLTPIKCGMDGLFHQDIGPGTRVAWPTNLGWMMGPWLIYASLLNRGTISLFDGAPHGRAFGEFVEKARVQVLGVIPSLVKAWRTSGCMEGLDWSRIQCFSSTGECSNESDMGYLMAVAGGKPVIEYCGGTEIGGGYITGTMVQPQVASMFSLPAMGLDFILIDEDGQPAEEVGEVALIGPSIGLSTRLLNKSHREVYFDGMPRSPTGEVLRRHGDQIQREFVSGAGIMYRALGRADDTMNLGGIKVSSAEIERTLNQVSGVLETAAVAINPPGGGPSLLRIVAVARPGVPKAEVSALQQELSAKLNPLFRIHELKWVDQLPRTASNKIMRRMLRDSA